jgi:hypothetical protein
MLLLSAGPAVQAALKLNPAPWAGFWDITPAAGALLAAGGIVIAVIPVRNFARTAGASRSAAGQLVP